MTKLIVGIDFGTSTTVVRYKKEGTEDILSVKDLNGTKEFIPSTIFRMEDSEQAVYGHEALSFEENRTKPGKLISNFKMGLISEDENVKNLSRSYIQDFLSFVYKKFSQEVQGLTYDMLDVYVSYPAKWSDNFINFMKESVSKVGFGENVNGISEPKAATYNVLHRYIKDQNLNKLLQEHRPLNVLMLDMGAGTTDIVIFQLQIDSLGKIEIDKMLPYPSVDNPCLCGGREIDKILSDYICKFVAERTGVELPDDFFTPYAAKKWKDNNLSSYLKNNPKGCSPIPQTIDGVLRWMPQGNSVRQSLTINRHLFEAITSDHWKNLYNLISSAIDLYKTKYNIGAEDIDILFLTGGHSQWYTVPNIFNGEGVNGYIGRDFKIGEDSVKALNFKKLKDEPWRMLLDDHPHECVAKGLCMQDAQIEINSFSSNGVWAKITINEVSSKIFNVVSINSLLPTAPKEIEYEIELNKNVVFSNLDFKILIDIYEGSNIETAKRYRLTMDHSENGALGRIIALILMVPILFPISFKFKTSMSITMQTDGTLDIKGILDCDHTKKIAFSRKDFE